MELRDCQNKKQIHDELLRVIGLDGRVVESSFEALTRMAEIARAEALEQAVVCCRKIEDEYATMAIETEHGEHRQIYDEMSGAADDCADAIRALQKTGGA